MTEGSEIRGAFPFVEGDRVRRADGVVGTVRAPSIDSGWARVSWGSVDPRPILVAPGDDPSSWVLLLDEPLRCGACTKRAAMICQCAACRVSNTSSRFASCVGCIAEVRGVHEGAMFSVVEMPLEERHPGDPCSKCGTAHGLHMNDCPIARATGYAVHAAAASADPKSAPPSPWKVGDAVEFKSEDLRSNYDAWNLGKVVEISGDGVWLTIQHPMGSIIRGVGEVRAADPKAEKRAEFFALAESAGDPGGGLLAAGGLVPMEKIEAEAERLYNADPTLDRSLAPHWNILGDSMRAHYLKMARQQPRLPPERVDHPAHYGGKDDPYEAIKVIDAWRLGFCLGNTVKYISRHEKKGTSLEDLKKARWYLDWEIAKREAMK